jgi:hypothetical protein
MALPGPVADLPAKKIFFVVAPRLGKTDNILAGSHIVYHFPRRQNGG